VITLLRVVTLEFTNWKPIPLDSVTDDFSATVQQILGSLASLVTVRIRLNRCFAFSLMLSLYMLSPSKLRDKLHSNGSDSPHGCSATPLLRAIA